MIDYAQSSENKIITVVAESFPHLQLGAIRDFQNIMRSNKYWDEDRWNESKHIYTFETGSFIEFISFDKFGKAHGPRRDILFINEANNLPYNIVDQLITRTRETVWLDWNPTEEFWFYTEMRPNRNDIDFITLTYLDNEAIDDVTKAEIESHKNNHQWWQVYGLGQLGTLEGRIYKDWQIIDEVPHEARLVKKWLDFGYSVDPTSIGDVYFYNGGYILDEIAYQKGLSNKQIADLIINTEKAPVIADSAEPKSIDEIYSYGVQILPSLKGPDSINQGIQFVQEQRMSITKRSINTIKEYRNYTWLKDKNGNYTHIPSPIFNHSMDGIRYAIASEFPRRKTQEEIMDAKRKNEELKMFDAFRNKKPLTGSRYLR